MQPHIHIITLGVADMQRATAFYETGLGWRRSDKSQGEIVFFVLGGLVMALYPHDKLAADIGIDTQMHAYTGATLAYNTRSEHEVDAIMAQVTDLGATIVKSPEKVFWGGYSGYFTDPDGHLWEVAYNPFVTFDDKGTLVL